MRGCGRAKVPPLRACTSRDKWKGVRERTLLALAASNAPTACYEEPKPPKQKSPLVSIWSFIDTNFLPLGLASALTLGYCFPSQAVAATNANIGVWATTIIFVASGLQMRRGEAAQALKQGRMFAIGLLAILAATPVVGLLVLKSPLQPFEFAVGLAVFCCMPTSLSANIALAGVRTSARMALYPAAWPRDRWCPCACHTGVSAPECLDESVRDVLLHSASVVACRSACQTLKACVCGCMQLHCAIS
jgi:hypothetical protein